jgi:hypothetical protein
MNRSQAYVRASRFYLTDELPSKFDELDEQDIMDFIRDHRWQPFEDWEPHGIWELIDDLAKEILEIHELATLATPDPEPEHKPETCKHCESDDVFRKCLCYGCWEDQYSDGAKW